MLLLLRLFRKLIGWIDFILFTAVMYLLSWLPWPRVLGSHPVARMFHPWCRTFVGAPKHHDHRRRVNEQDGCGGHEVPPLLERRERRRERHGEVDRKGQYHERERLAGRTRDHEHEHMIIERRGLRYAGERCEQTRLGTSPFREHDE